MLKSKTISSPGRISIYILIALGCLGSSLPSLAQDVRGLFNASLAEIIYLQLDNKVYTTDQTIWFKAIVTSAQDHIPTDLSGVLHVELIDPNERVAEKKLIKLDNGIGDGFFQLSDNYVEGSYLVRAYTEWDRNFGSDFFFNQYVQVFPSSGRSKSSPIKSVTLREGQNKERLLDVTFDPFTIDSAHTRELTLFISLDEKKDTLFIKKGSANNYLLEYPIPADSRLITFQLLTKNDFRYSKAIVLEKDYLDLQFFPESGELVQGLPALVGFKALESSGKGRMVEGDIIDRKGEVVASFKSNQLGMGAFTLSKVDSSGKYSARIISKDKVSRMYPLPAVAAIGNVLSVKKGNESVINVKVSSNYLTGDSVFIRASCRGVIYFDVKGRLRKGELEFLLPSSDFPEGIIDFTLMDASLSPVAERLYFNLRPGNRVSVLVSSNKDSYVEREQSRLSIETRDSAGQPLITSVSLLVFNKSQQPQAQDARQNILSYFLLNSELRGEVENPGYYFNKNESRYLDLDALLLTQGWRKYKYTSEPGKILFQPEINLTVSGKVKGILFNNNIKKGIGLTMMSFGKNTSVQEQVADSLGRFSFILDGYGENMNILIQSKNKSGTKKNYSITLDKKEPPAILFNHPRPVGEPDSVVLSYVKKSIERKRAEYAFTAATEGITLGEVVVKSYFMTPERKLVTDRFGKAKTVIEGDAIREKEAKWSYGLYSVLMFNFPDKVRVRRLSDGVLYASLYNSEVTLVVIDGIPVKVADYVFIPSIAPSEVKSFELIEYAKDFRNLYCEALPEGCGMNTPSIGNVIAIYTYGGKGLFGANPAVGIMKTAVPVFATPREFYAPKYEQLKPDDWLKPDKRTLLYWEPRVSMDNSGKGSAEFYTSDLTGPIQVIVEAISREGEIGYKELLLNVGKRNK